MAEEHPVCGIRGARKPGPVAAGRKRVGLCDWLGLPWCKVWGKVQYAENGTDK